MLNSAGMKHLAVLAAATLALLLGQPVRDAEACTPVPTCSNYHCQDQAAVLEARLVATGVESTGGEDTQATLRIESAFGDAPEATPGTDVTLAAYGYLFQDGDVGQTFVFYAERTLEGALRLVDKYTADQLAGCFAGGTETIAATVLGPTCFEELDMPAERTLPVTACVEYTPFGCSAGGGGAGAGVVLALGLVALARPRRR